MSAIVLVSSSRSAISTTQGLVSHVARRMSGAGHETQFLVLRDLPAEPLLAGDITDQRIAAAVAAIAGADALVIASPVYQSSFSGLLKVFLDLLPQFAFRGKAVLPLLTGGSTAHVLAVDYALRPVLASLGASHIAPGWFVPSRHIRPYPDGGVLIDQTSLVPLTQIVTEFLAELARRPSPEGLPVRLDQATAPRVSPVPGTPDLQILRVGPDDPRARELLTEIALENDTRSPLGGQTGYDTGDPGRNGAQFVVAIEAGSTIAGGIFHRGADRSAEITGIWTSGRHRRRGVASRLIAEFENFARSEHTRGIRLVIGPRHPEARSLFRTAGYDPVLDETSGPEPSEAVAFTKDLWPAAAPARLKVPQPA
jgi:SsuE family FMN reductase